MPPSHCVVLFSTKSFASGLADRLSKGFDVLVAPDDGLKSNMNGRVGSKLTSRIHSTKPSEHIPTILQMEKCFLLLGLEY